MTSPDISDSAAGPPPVRVRVDLDALVANWHGLARLAAPSRTAAVVKADAYGLGLERVVPALRRAGCEDFFVAAVDEALAARAALPDARIYALGGAAGGAIAGC